MPKTEAKIALAGFALCRVGKRVSLNDPIRERPLGKNMFDRISPSISLIFKNAFGGMTSLENITFCLPVQPDRLIRRNKNLQIQITAHATEVKCV